MDRVAHHQRVVPVIVAVILVRLPRLRGACCVIGTAVVTGRLAGLGRIRSRDGASAAQVEIDQGLQPDGEAEIVPCRKDHRSATCCCRCCNGLVDGRRVQGFAIADRAIRPNIEEEFAAVRLWRLREGCVPKGTRGKGERRQLQNITALHTHPLCVVTELGSGYAFSSRRPPAA